MKKWVKGLIAAVVVLGLGFYFETRNTSPVPTEMLTILRAPDSVKAYRTIGFLTNSPGDSEETFRAFYQKETNGVAVPQAMVDYMVQIITVEDRKSDQRPDCMYRPGFAMSFTKGNQGFDIFFCFECGGIMTQKVGDEKIQDLGLTGKFQTELLNIFKKLFPTDPNVQKL